MKSFFLITSASFLLIGCSSMSATSPSENNNILEKNENNETVTKVIDRNSYGKSTQIVALLKANKRYNKKIKGIYLDRPMTIKVFFKKFAKLNNTTYHVVGNGNIPFNAKVKISSVKQLNDYILATKGYHIEEEKEEFFNRVVVVH